MVVYHPVKVKGTSSSLVTTAKTHMVVGEMDKPSPFQGENCGIIPRLPYQTYASVA